MNRFLAVFLSIITFVYIGAKASTAEDIPLSAYYATKGIAPFITLRNFDMNELSYATLPFLTLPSFMVLYHRWHGEPKDIKLWRNISFGTDLGLSGAGFVTGSIIAIMNTSSGDDRTALIGEITMISSVVYGAMSFLNRVQFSTEESKISRLSLEPIFVAQSNLTGIMLRYKL